MLSLPFSEKAKTSVKDKQIHGHTPRRDRYTDTFLPADSGSSNRQGTVEGREIQAENTFPELLLVTWCQGLGVCRGFSRNGFHRPTYLKASSPGDGPFDRIRMHSLE